MLTTRTSLVQNLFEHLTILSFDPKQKAWDKYKEFAIPKIEQGTITLNGLQNYIPDYTAEKAEQELKELETILDSVTELRTKIQGINDVEFQDFKDAAIKYFDQVEQLHDMLEDQANVNTEFLASLEAIREDWDSEEDSEWDSM